MEREVESVIPGRRAVLEALRANRPIRKVLLARTAHGGVVREVIHEAKRRGVVVQSVDPHHLNELSPAAHQGVIALASIRRTVDVDDIVEAAQRRREAPFVLVLDGVEDPRNLGALIRSADAAGVHGVVIPRHRAAGLTPAVAKSSAGAVEHVLIATVTNLVRSIEVLKQSGLWVVGADAAAAETYYAVRLVPPLALVMGGEGRGLSRLVREHCDQLVRLPMRGKVASLNVSVAAGVLLYEVVRQLESGGTPSRARS